MAKPLSERDILQEARSLLKAGTLELSLHAIYEYIRFYFSDDLLIYFLKEADFLSFQLTTLQTQKRNRLCSFDELQRTSNQLAYAVLEFINLLEKQGANSYLEANSNTPKFEITFELDYDTLTDKEIENLLSKIRNLLKTKPDEFKLISKRKGSLILTIEGTEDSYKKLQVIHSLKLISSLAKLQKLNGITSHDYYKNKNQLALDLSNTNCSHGDFRKVNLEKAFFENSNLAHTKFTRANLRFANFNHCDLKKADFFGAILKESSFQHADLSYARMYRSDLSRANLSRAILFKANFSAAKLLRANLSHSDLRYTNFYDTNLIGADFSNTDLSAAKLTGANLFYANLENANVSNADFTNSNLSLTILKNVELRSAKLQNTIFDISQRAFLLKQDIDIDKINFVKALKK